MRKQCNSQNGNNRQQPLYTLQDYLFQHVIINSVLLLDAAVSTSLYFKPGGANLAATRRHVSTASSFGRHAHGIDTP
jgi:hypothetical protein